MSKITIVGDVVNIKSSMKLEDLMTIHKYRPDALALMGGEDGKDEVFRVFADPNAEGSVQPYAVVFSKAAQDGAAYVNIHIDPKGDAREYVADTFGVAITNLNKVEEGLPSVLESINNEKAAMVASIEVAG